MNTADDSESSATPRLYSDLSEFWPFVSPPASYPEEVATFRARFLAHGVPDGASVLHLGCGGGSIDYHLKQHYHVTGIDLSEGMLKHARGLNPECDYYVGDIRDSRIGRTFDAVLVHDAISYMTSIEELQATYRTAAAHLNPGGVMIALPEELRGRVRQNHADVWTESAGGLTVTIMMLDHDPDPADHKYDKLFVFVIREGESVRVESDRHINGLFELDEFLGAMASAGFDAKAEPWELSDWEPDEVPLPLITAVKVR